MFILLSFLLLYLSPSSLLLLLPLLLHSCWYSCHHPRMIGTGAVLTSKYKKQSINLQAPNVGLSSSLTGGCGISFFGLNPFDISWARGLIMFNFEKLSSSHGKLRLPFLRVPIMGIVVLLGICWDPPILGNYHVKPVNYHCCCYLCLEIYHCYLKS